MRIRLPASVAVASALQFVTGSTLAQTPGLEYPFAENGALFQYDGTLGVSAVSGSVYDKDIHSLSPRTFTYSGGSYTFTSDSYVLQGGDPFGGDTFDTFEESQTPGLFDFGNGLQVQTFYQDDTTEPLDKVAGPKGNPDTSYARLINNSGVDFSGRIELSGTQPLAYGGSFFDVFFDLVDLPGNGGSASLSLTQESSNVGGFNPNPHVPDAGATLAMLGLSLAALAGFGRGQRAS